VISWFQALAFNFNLYRYTLVGKVGRDARPVIPAVVPTLVKKLGDSKIVVRQANMRVLNTLYHTLPGATMNALFNTLNDSGGNGGGDSANGNAANGMSSPKSGAGPVSARVKEEILNVVIRAMLDETAFPTKDVDEAGLYKFNPVDPKRLKAPGFNP
jgi:hypothetical protein